MAFSVPRSASYAMRMLVQLALAREGRHISLTTVSAATGISRKFLEQLAAPLRRAGIIVSRSGKDGGYRLAVKPHTLTVRQVFEAIHGPFAPVRCVANPQACYRSGHCECRLVYLKMAEAVNAVLDEITIERLVKRRMAVPPILYEIEKFKSAAVRHC